MRLAIDSTELNESFVLDADNFLRILCCCSPQRALSCGAIYSESSSRCRYRSVWRHLAPCGRTVWRQSLWSEATTHGEQLILSGAELDFQRRGERTATTKMTAVIIAVYGTTYRTHIEVQKMRKSRTRTVQGEGGVARGREEKVLGEYRASLVTCTDPPLVYRVVYTVKIYNEVLNVCFFLEYQH